MEKTAIILFELALTCYFAATILGVVEMIRGGKAVGGGLMLFTSAGFLLHTANLAVRFIGEGHMPVTSLHEASSFFAWSTVFLFFIIERRYKIGLLGAFILPGVFAFMLSSSVLPRQAKLVGPVLQGYWLFIHTAFAFIGDAAFALACGVGVMYLVQEHFVKGKILGGMFHRLPSLQILDEVNYRLVTIGFPLLTLAIISGTLWSQSVFGTFWRWDVKEVWSLITWFIYAGVLHVRMVAGWHGRKSAILSIAGFVAVLFTFFGVNLLLKGYHSFV
jgi:cytochrome c-type biogenesis protein CcsB